MKRGTLRYTEDQYAEQCGKNARRAAVPDAPSPGAAPAPLNTGSSRLPDSGGVGLASVSAAARCPLKLKQPTVPESAILAAVLTALRLHPRVAWAHRMNTGAYAVGDRFVRFGFPGLSDIIGQTVSGAFLAIEVKRAGKVPTDDQRAFLELVTKSGGVSFVARSVEDVAANL
jgi:hypothetical protein